MSEKEETQPNEVAIANDDESQLIAARLASLKAETKWDLPVNRGKALNGTSLQEWLLKKEEEATRSAVERGIGYALLKRELGHGAFEGWLKDQSIAPRTAQRCMKSAALLMMLSDSNAARGALLPQRKLDVLVALPAPVVDDLFNEGELDNAADMTRDQLSEIVKLRKDLESAGSKMQRMSDTIAEQDEQLRKQGAMPETQLYILELRRAVQEETEALRANLAGLHTALDQVRMLPQDISQADIDSIAHPLMYALQGIHAGAGAVFDKGFEIFPSFKPDMDVMPPVLDKEEVLLLRRRAREFADRVEQRGVLRQGDVAAEKAGKGRKG